MTPVLSFRRRRIFFSLDSLLGLNRKQHFRARFHLRYCGIGLNEFGFSRLPIFPSGSYFVPVTKVIVKTYSPHCSICRRLSTCDFRQRKMDSYTYDFMGWNEQSFMGWNEG
jgi:hypothetical protein